MHIPDFNYHRPSSIQEACRILSESPDGAPLAGGTDLLVEIKQGLRQHQDIVSLMAIEELKSIHQDAAKLFIGAGLTHNEIAASPVIKESFPAIAEAASTIGTDQVRNAGTIGGNLCTGASCCDMAPILMALSACVEFSSFTKTRTVPLDEFFISHRETCIEKGEVLKKIIVLRGKAGTGTCFEKFGLREAASVSVASVAVAMSIKHGICADARVVIGAVAPTPKISTGASDVLIGKKISELCEDSSIVKHACEAAALDSRPIDDLRGSADYRQHLIKVLTKRALVKALSRAST
jgi:CO/xanthine dehydrogenase FAD-binding subunit